MTRFHTDEYIDFLSKVSPETVEELTGNGTRCKLGSRCNLSLLFALTTDILQFSLGMTILPGMGYSSSVQSLLVDP